MSLILSDGSKISAIIKCLIKKYPMYDVRCPTVAAIISCSAN